MNKLKCFLVLFACIHGVQAFAKSGAVRFEDFLLRDTSHIIHGTLNNGFQYYIIKEPHNAFQMSLVQKSGAYDDGETQEISHLLEHMLATANRQLATGETLGSYLKKLGKDYGTGFNAFTGANFMKYELYQLKSEQAYADSCMEVLADIAGSTSICAMDLEEQRERLLNEVANRKYVLDRRLADACRAVFRMGYSHEEWREMRLNSAKKITLPQLEAFCRRWYHPQNQCLLVTGNVPDGVEEMIKQKFASHPRIPAPTSTIIDYSQKDLLVERCGNASCMLTLSFELPLLTQAEKESSNFFRDYYALKKVNGALFEKNMKSKFANMNCFSVYQVSDRFKLTTAFTYNLNEELPGGGLLAFVDSVAAYLDDVRTNGVKLSMPKDTLKKEEVALRRAQAMKKLQEGDGKGNTIDGFLSPDACFIYSLPLYKQEDSDAYWSFVLSGKDISDYCKNFIKKSRIKIECVLPYGYPEKQITEKLNALQASAQSETVSYEDFLVTNPSNIQQGVLANGFRYYLCNNNFPDNQLEMRLIQKSGTGDDEGIPGISLLLRRMLFSENLHAGSIGVVRDKLDELKMQRIPTFRALNGLIPNLSAYCSEMENGCTEFNLFRLNNERAYAASCIELLSEIAGHARFSASELERQKEFLVNEISNCRYDFAKFEENNKKAVFVDGCTLDEQINNQINSVRRITLQQLEDYYQRWYVPQNQCLYVFGEMPADIVDIIKQKFGNRPNVSVPERTINELSNQKLLMAKHDNPVFVVTLDFVKPRVAPSATKDMDYLRKTAIFNRFCEIIGFPADVQVTSSMGENDHLFRRPVFEMKIMKVLDLYADEQQLNNFIDDVTKKLDSVMHYGLQAHISQYPIEERKKLQQQALDEIRNYIVMDTHTCIKNNFVYSKPLLKDGTSSSYFQYEVSEQDIQDCCKELFDNCDMRIVCTTPYGYSDADIKAKLEAFCQKVKIY